jgi:hypothetical protein
MVRGAGNQTLENVRRASHQRRRGIQVAACLDERPKRGQAFRQDEAVRRQPAIDVDRLLDGSFCRGEVALADRDEGKIDQAFRGPDARGTVALAGGGGGAVRPLGTGGIPLQFV